MQQLKQRLYLEDGVGCSLDWDRAVMRGISFLTTFFMIYNPAILLEFLKIDSSHRTVDMAYLCYESVRAMPQHFKKYFVSTVCS